MATVSSALCFCLSSSDTWEIDSVEGRGVQALYGDAGSKDAVMVQPVPQVVSLGKQWGWYQVAPGSLWAASLLPPLQWSLLFGCALISAPCWSFRYEWPAVFGHLYLMLPSLSSSVGPHSSSFLSHLLFIFCSLITIYGMNFSFNFPIPNLKWVDCL